MSTKLKCSLLFCFVAFGLLFVSVAGAKTVTLSWDKVNYSGLGGYELHYGTKSGKYTQNADVGNVTTYQVPSLEGGVTYYFAVTSYGTGGASSSYSNEAIVRLAADSTAGSSGSSSGSDAAGSGTAGSGDTGNASAGNGDTGSGSVAPAAGNLTGWWYDPSMNGTGISIEVQGNSLFMAWYFYDEQNGEAVWVSSGGTMIDSAHYSGGLLQWNGYPPDSGYAAPKAETVGTVDISFSSANKARITWTRGPYSGSVKLSRFMDTITSGDHEYPDMQGWWYDPSKEGMGVFVEVKGGIIFTAWYNYRTDGSPRWWSTGGSLDLNALFYQGPLQEWSGGQCPGSTKANQAQPVSQPIGTVSVDFLDQNEAYLNWGGQQLHLKRFQFGNGVN